MDNHHHHLLFWKRRFLPCQARVGRFPQGRQPNLWRHFSRFYWTTSGKEKSPSASYPPICIVWRGWSVWWWDGCVECSWGKESTVRICTAFWVRYSERGWCSEACMADWGSLGIWSVRVTRQDKTETWHFHLEVKVSFHYQCYLCKPVLIANHVHFLFCHYFYTLYARYLCILSHV